jgi:hypothetical protein
MCSLKYRVPESGDDGSGKCLQTTAGQSLVAPKQAAPPQGPQQWLEGMRALASVRENPSTILRLSRAVGGARGGWEDMPGYRIYFLDDQNHIRSRTEFECDTQEEAVAKANQLVNGQAVELWAEDHFIADLFWQLAYDFSLVGTSATVAKRSG